MFKNYKDITDVVSLFVYCPSERAFLLTKESSGEYWIPSSKTVKNCWKITAHQMNFELFGMDSSQCQPLRVSKIWLPNHPKACVYHTVYKVAVKSDVKRRTKLRAGIRNRLQWVSAAELEQQRAHATLRSPELVVFSRMAVGEESKDNDSGLETGMLVEICEDNALVGVDVAGGAIALASPHCQLLQAANYTKDGQATTRIPRRLHQQQCTQSPPKSPRSFRPETEASPRRTEIVIQLRFCRGAYLYGGGVLGYVASCPACIRYILDQVRLYREFITMVYPAAYMSVSVFTQFMVDHGWERAQCSSLFRAADISCRGGLSFLELLLWSAALEPNTQHSGLAADVRCRYIFRYFDSNRDLKLEYLEFKELMAASRSTRQLPVDALSVTRDADLCLKQLGLNANGALPLAEFLRGVEEQRIRGTSAMLRSTNSLAVHLRDLQDRELQSTSTMKLIPSQGETIIYFVGEGKVSVDLQRSRSGGAVASSSGDYVLASCVVRLNRFTSPEMLHLNTFDEDAVSLSTAKLVSARANSLEHLGLNSPAAEAFAAIRYFAMAVDKPVQKRLSGGVSVTQTKAAYAWLDASEEAALGSLLCRLAEAVRPICLNEPRLLKLSSPVYAIGDLHGNLSALLAMESALWPNGPALVPAQLLFLGDYVDRGPHGAELMAYLLAAKLQRPHSVYLIRGNHETRDIQKMFTFHLECFTKYGEVEGARVWNEINQVFDTLALAAVVDDKVFCCHGGIPPPWVCPLISAIDKIPAPLPRPSEQSSIAWELLWNDPVKPNKVTATMSLELSANDGFAANARRGAGHVFDARALERFLRANKLSLVLRAHELHHHGFMCQLRGRLVSVFSSSRYCGAGNESCVALLQRGKLRLVRVTD